VQGISQVNLATVVRFDVLGFYPIPKSWNKDKKLALAGQFMRNRSDADNLLKAVGDAIFRDAKTCTDAVVAVSAAEQRWEDALGVRMVVRIFTEEDQNISLFGYKPVTGGTNLARLIHRIKPQ